MIGINAFLGSLGESGWEGRCKISVMLALRTVTLVRRPSPRKPIKLHSRSKVRRFERWSAPAVAAETGKSSRTIWANDWLTLLFAL